MAKPSTEEHCDEIWHYDAKVSVLEGAEGRTELVSLSILLEAEDVMLTVRRTASSVVSAPSWDTLQISMNEHARFGAKALKLNHAQDPNSRVSIHPDKVEVVARRTIPAGTPLSFNYNSTEYAMAEPFTDWETGELVGGFSKASSDERQWLVENNLVAPHVLELDSAAANKRNLE